LKEYGRSAEIFRTMRQPLSWRLIMKLNGLDRRLVEGIALKFGLGGDERASFISSPGFFFLSRREFASGLCPTTIAEGDCVP
jgi:hypothetical protein